jgi:hypothetical protein
MEIGNKTYRIYTMLLSPVNVSLFVVAFAVEAGYVGYSCRIIAASLS